MTAAAVPCQALPDGATVETGDSDYEPDALVNCGEPMADDAVAAPHPVIIVEVLSPGTTATDTGGKLAYFFRVPSVAHYLRPGKPVPALPAAAVKRTTATPNKLLRRFVPLNNLGGPRGKIARPGSPLQATASPTNEASFTP